ncbi:hypothetical protein VPHK250G1_0074 [Vibrio phage K250 g1]
MSQISFNTAADIVIVTAFAIAVLLIVRETKQ